MVTYGPRREKTCLQGIANNTGADQPAHLRSLISTYVIRLLESIISRLATSEISIFWLVTVAEETGLKLTLSDTPKTGFLVTRPIFGCTMVIYGPRRLVLLLQAVQTLMNYHIMQHFIWVFTVCKSTHLGVIPIHKGLSNQEVIILNVKHNIWYLGLSLI